MGTYEDGKYKDGLSGDAPSIFGPGIFGTEEGYKAQQEGYRAFLRNESLIKQAREDREKQEAAARWSPSDDDYSSSSTSNSNQKNTKSDRPAQSKHPTIVLTLAMSVSITIFGFFLHKTYFKETPRPSAEFPTPSDTCSGASNTFFFPEKGITKIKVPLQTGCWSGWITTPLDWPSREYSWTGPGGIWIQFLDGKPEWRPAGTVTSGVRRGIFRVSGRGNLFVSIYR